MYFRILLVISFIGIGSGAPPAHPQDKANHATYSQSFVREDVPLSYQYSAVHYYNPKKHVEPERSNSKRNNYNPESHRLSHKDIQYAAVPQKPNEYIYSTERVVYTPLTPTPTPIPIVEYEQYEEPAAYDKLAVSKDNLEPKQVPLEAKDIKPSTYKPHLNHHVKIYNSPKFTLQPHSYHRLNLNTQATIVKPRNLEMEDILRRLNIYQQLQYSKKNAKNIVPVTTESIKYTNVLDPVISFVPKQNIPHEYNRYSMLQPIPREAYHSNNNVISINGPPENSGRIQMYSRLNNYIHLKKPNTQ